MKHILSTYSVPINQKDVTIETHQELSELYDRGLVNIKYTNDGTFLTMTKTDVLEDVCKILNIPCILS